MRLVSEKVTSAAVTMADAIVDVQGAFEAYARGEARVVPVTGGKGLRAGQGFVVKTGVFDERKLIGVKIGTYWATNDVHGIDSHHSTVVFLDPDTGYVDAVVGASRLTALRTAAADAVAARALARTDAHVVAIIGAGNQAWYDLLALCEVRPIDRVLIATRSSKNGVEFAKRAESRGLRAECVATKDAVSEADIIVTATPSRTALFEAEWVRPGTHISAMGADTVGKQELPVSLVASSKLFTDVVAQAVSVGEFQHAIRMGLVAEHDLTPIGDVLIGAGAGRTGPQEITIFDSSGRAIQDIVVAARALELALEQGTVIEVEWS